MNGAEGGASGDLQALLLAADRIDEYEPAVVSGAELLVGVQKLDAEQRSVRRDIDKQVIGDPQRFDLLRRLAEADIGDVVGGIVGEPDTSTMPNFDGKPLPPQCCGLTTSVSITRSHLILGENELRFTEFFRPVLSPEINYLKISACSLACVLRNIQHIGIIYSTSSISNRNPGTAMMDKLEIHQLRYIFNI